MPFRYYCTPHTVCELTSVHETETGPSTPRWHGITSLMEMVWNVLEMRHYVSYVYAFLLL